MLNFFRNLFGVSIKSQVMKAVSDKISAAQKAYDDEVYILKTKLRYRKMQLLDELDVALQNLDESHCSDKANLVGKHVGSVLSKIL